MVAAVANRVTVNQNVSSPRSDRTAFLDVTGGLDNGQDWVSGANMGKMLNGHCLAGIDENRVLIMGGKWNGAPGGGFNNDGLQTILYDLSAPQL